MMLKFTLNGIELEGSVPQVIGSTVHSWSLEGASSYLVLNMYIYMYQCCLMHEVFVCMCVCDSVVCVW